MRHILTMQNWYDARPDIRCWLLEQQCLVEDRTEKRDWDDTLRSLERYCSIDDFAHHIYGMYILYREDVERWKRQGFDRTRDALILAFTRLIAIQKQVLLYVYSQYAPLFSHKYPVPDCIVDTTEERVPT